MSTTSVTVKGYVVALPRAVDARQARVAILQDDVEYRVVPRGAGADLDNVISALVEVTGLEEESEGIRYVMVRGYKTLEDDSWLEE
ncbi:MAG: hypothetical protein ZNDK_1013 [Candidatus Desulfovibrio kirbyi]|jgi:hypothetical protein|uniref:Uncharacterized protein n=1 Tax=Candidatus Desulfovibrio kirbyi TaxID=2696086 RepID=A0A6L2R710_9BACT|nr:MAG: hypothetical protein ZNDK_1013 [Candidatus Desulfovibrio kirbyi]